MIALDLTADEDDGGAARVRAARRPRDLLVARRRPFLRVHLGRAVDAGLAAVLAALQRRPARAAPRSRGRRRPLAARARASARR